jgi:ubiquitin C-terminal hydrolase
MTMSLQYKSTLEKAIRDHLSEETIDGLYKCEKCGKESKAKVKYEFVRLPKYLMLHIKRFDSGFNKIKSNLEYNSRLDLSM